MSSTPRPAVAVIGAGRIGSAIAECVARAGFELWVYARTAAKAAPLEALGAHVATSVAEAAGHADVVITSVRDDDSVVDVVRDRGLLHAMRPNAVHVGATTISPTLADELARWHQGAGSRYVAGPVVGRRERAFERKLVTFAAGDPEAIEAARPVLESYGPVRIVGERPSTANVLKLLNNFITAAWIELASEVYALGEKTGVDRAEAHDLLLWALDKPGMRAYTTEIRDRAFDDAGFELTTGLKDVELMLGAGAAAGAPLPFAEIVREKMLKAIEAGLGAKDWAALSETARSDAGLE